MLEIIKETPPYIPLTIHCVIGITAAAIAQKKGYSLRSWLLIGLVGGTFALVKAIIMQNKSLV